MSRACLVHVATLAVATSIAGPALAADETACDVSGCTPGASCVCSPTNYGSNQNALSRWAVSVNSSDDLTGISTNEFIAAFNLATEEWNQNANGRFFQMHPGLPYSTLETLPPNDADCTGIDYSLVRVGDTGGTSGFTWGRCCSGGVCRLFEIVLDPNRSWTVGAVTPGSGVYDLVATMVHELGHASGLGHSPCDEAAVMRATTVGRSWRRDLYQYDLHCLQSCAWTDYRDLDVGSIERTGTNSYSSERTLGSTSWKIADVGTGKTWVGSTWNDSWVLADEVCSSGARWMRGSGNDYNRCISGYDARNGIGPVDAVWRDRDIEMQRVFYGHYVDSDGQCDLFSSHAIKYLRSGNEFLSTTSGTMSYCSAMTGWFSCAQANETLMTTSERPAVAWLAGNVGTGHSNGATLFAWTNHDREDDADDREIWISVGSISNYLLPQPTKTGIRSSVGPGLACSMNFSGSYDCLLAYVEHGDGMNQVRIRQLAVVQETNRFRVDVGATTYALGADVRSGAAIALGRTSADNKFLAAIRRQAMGNPSQVFISSTGTAWSRESAWNLSNWATAPSMTGHWTGAAHEISGARGGGQ